MRLNLKNMLKNKLITTLREKSAKKGVKFN